MNPIRASLLMSSLAAAAVAQAQTAPAPTPAAATPPVVVTKKDASTSLTWNGITLYGIVDIGLQYQTHGAPISDYFPGGTESVIQKNSNNSVTGLVGNNLSQSRIGLSGLEPIPNMDMSFVFRLETFFNPQSGNLSDGLKSLTLNNGKALDQQATGVDSSVAGQLFAGAAYAGVSSPRLGSLTFGRHVTPLADGISKYDPMGAAQAFSLLGFSGTTAGGGDTEDRRLDDSVKYTLKAGPVHVGALYQFNGSNGGANTAFQGQLGFDFLGGGSVDAYYAKKKDAVAAASLSQAQVAGLADRCNPPPTIPPTIPPPASQCYSVSNSLAATISDNETYGIMALYNFGRPTVYAGYEDIKFKNPDQPLPDGYITIGGYQLAYLSQKAYTNNKTLKVLWAGGKYAMDQLEFTLAYYGYQQDSFAPVSCSTAALASCKGELNVISGVADYKFTKRFDAYLGTMWSEAKDGLANGYLRKGPSDTASTLTSTVGMRFRF
jgi:predicted porin